MDDGDFKVIGLGIGDKNRLKQRCMLCTSETAAEETRSAVVDRIRLGIPSNKRDKPNKKTKCNQPSNKRGRKETEGRRLKIGWKHSKGPGIPYDIVPASKGGGSGLNYDADKSTDLANLTRQIANVFAPGGRSEQFDLNLRDIHYYLATFTGAPLPAVINELPFTVESYFQHLKKQGVYPVRVYLHTSRLFEVRHSGLMATIF